MSYNMHNNTLEHQAWKKTEEQLYLQIFTFYNTNHGLW